MIPVMPATELRLRFADRAALAREFETNLQYGRAFVGQAKGVGLLQDCTLILVRVDDGAELQLEGKAVLLSEGEGVGVELRPFDAQVAARLEAFVHSDASEARYARAGNAPHEPSALREPSQPDDADPSHVCEAVARDSDSHEEGRASPLTGDDLQHGPARHQRLRKLNPTQQHKLARSGDFNDRVLLERLYGRAVWEALLQNPKLTIPEVATIARKGSVPRPLLELITENVTWIQAPIVRRALLGNPRTSTESIMRLLRLTPKHELKIIHKTTTYSSQVREAARRALEL
jgi:hypothetical protein